jgi:hypothetical protein
MVAFRDGYRVDLDQRGLVEDEKIGCNVPLVMIKFHIPA